MLPRARAPRVLGMLALVVTSSGAWLSLMATAAQPAVAYSSHQLCDADERSCVELRLHLAASDARISARALEAAKAAADVCRRWLGPIQSAITVDPKAGVLDAPAAMSVEAQVALDVTRAWAASSGAGRAGDVLVEGLARYLHTLAVEDLFDRRYQRRAYAVHAEPMLRGSFSMPIRGIHRTRLTTLRAETESIAAQLALAFATLERYLAPTRLQRAVTAAVASRPGDIDTFVTGMESALGQELRWLFETVLAERRYDYALTEFTSEPALCQDTPCFRTRAVVERRTDSAFASTTVPGVLLTFADGQSLTSASDARVSIEEFYFESPAPADTATIDSAGVLLLDRNRLDNRKTLAPATDVNVARWTAQWTVWLQHALLAYASFF